MVRTTPSLAALHGPPDIGAAHWGSRRATHDSASTSSSRRESRHPRRFVADSTAQVVQTVGAVFALLLLAAATNALAKRIGIRFPIALVLVGVAISELGEVFDFLAPLARIDISPTVAFFVFLPTLVFEAAFNMDGRDLRENLGPILTLAVPACSSRPSSPASSSGSAPPSWDSSCPLQRHSSWARS